MSYLKFDVDVDTYVTREADPDDEWSNDSTDGTVTVNSCTLVNEDGYNVLGTDFEVSKGQSIFLVWAQYGTGDSFGSYGGKYELCKICNNAEDARIEAERLENVTDYSFPWTGYFEWLNGVYYEEFEVK